MEEKLKNYSLNIAGLTASITVFDSILIDGLTQIESFNSFLLDSKKHDIHMTIQKMELTPSFECFQVNRFPIKGTSRKNIVCKKKSKEESCVYALEGNIGILYLIECTSEFHYKISIKTERTKLKYILWDAIEVCYNQSFISRNKIMLHASCVRYKDKAYLFVGKSGRGKSTHARMWMEKYKEAELINDDSPIVSVETECIKAYGAPWSGKTKCYKNICAPIAGIVQIHQSRNNMIQRASKLRAMALLFPCTVGDIKWERERHAKVIDIIESIVERIPVYDLHCTPTIEAAEICASVIIPKNEV